MLSVSVIVLGMVSSAIVLVPAPVMAAANTVLAYWDMNEPPGAITMLDSSTNAINGVIGSAVQTGVAVDGETAYRWSNVIPTAPPAKPERLVQVNNAALNPGTRDYAVTIRYETTKKFGNIIQKGQAHVSGGYFKLEQPGGFPNCFFTGPKGAGAVKSTVATNDGHWHVIRCERTATQISLYIDGVLNGQITTATGNISNTCH